MVTEACRLKLVEGCDRIERELWYIFFAIQLNGLQIRNNFQIGYIQKPVLDAVSNSC